MNFFLPKVDSFLPPERSLSNFSSSSPFVLAFLLLLIACSSNDIPLPQSIGSMRLVRVQSGQEARRKIDRLHGKQISLLRGYIGTYEAKNGAGVLWISEHTSEKDATGAIEKMAQGLQQGRQQEFRHFRRMKLEQRPVYLAVGMGQAHYFFQNRAKVIWLAVDPFLAKEAIRDAVSKIK